MLKKIFLSHPFTGDEINNRADAEEIAENIGVEYPSLQIFNPLQIFEPLEESCEEHVILAACMNLIKHCDAVLQCEDWEISAGCRAEAAFAIVNGIRLVDHDGLDLAMLEGDGDD